MNYDLEIDQEQQTISVHVHCLLDQEIRKEILLVIASQVNLTHFSRVIIDLTKSSFNPAEPITGALDLTSFMRAIGIPPHVKLAFLYADSERHRKYFENAAQCDGFNLRYFKNLDEAMAWLE